MRFCGCTRSWKNWRRSNLIKILTLCGSPVPESSTEILLRKVASTIKTELAGHKVRHRLVQLNELEFVPCQSCGEAPTPKFCFFDDDLTGVYRDLAAADCVLFGSPIYFDAVSTQAKAFIDRCNCVRPADFNNVDPEHDFLKLLPRKRPGAMVLVGGEQGWFEGARRCIAGWFKWVEVVNEGMMKFQPVDFVRSGEAADNEEALAEAAALGKHLAEVLVRDYGHG
ncbi:hypothetical protein GF377_08450 [candidate division GN15 bacterium]|nr:hypothetical protein [candidate division GN15 bacterium]